MSLDHGAEPIFPDLTQSLGQNIPLNRKHIFSHLHTELPANWEHLYLEPHFHYAPIPYFPNIKLRGYFQSEKYFAHHKETIIKLFAPSDEIMEYLTGKYSDLLNDPKTVSIHLRFYHEDPEERIYVGCRKQFIRDAMALFPEDSHFIVFSNRMQRCKEFFQSIPGSIRFIENEPHYYDFYLMSLCKHNIICNSTIT